jgi:ribonuclease III
VGAMLYEQFPEMREGELTRRRSTLVDEPSLAGLAAKLEIGSKLRIGKGAERDCGRESPSILSDAFEALIGAYFLDSGIDAVEQYVRQIFLPLIEDSGDRNLLVDAKSQLQQWVQKNYNGAKPEYPIINVSGPDHAKKFTVEVWIEGKCYGVGEGRSKQDAEKQAATAALNRLELI